MNRVIALGFFDGVHVGHMALMEMVKFRAKQENAVSTVFTFDIHPTQMLTGKPIPFIIDPDRHSEELMRLADIDEVIVSHFDERMAQMPWDEFVTDILYRKYGAVHIVSGVNNRFGYKGDGSSKKLALKCRELGIGYDCIDDVKIDGITVSSTYVRNLIGKGDMAKIAKFLGYPYTVCGRVIHGRKVGREIGVPTINLVLHSDMQKPPFGVYATRVTVDEKSYISVTNVGVKPSFQGQCGVTVEAHIVDFDGDLYGKEVRIEFYKFLRSEKTFESIEGLRSAVGKNINQAVEYFGENLVWQNF